MDRLRRLFYLSIPEYRFQIEGYPEFGIAGISSATFSRKEKYQLVLEIVGEPAPPPVTQERGTRRVGAFIKGSTLPTYKGEDNIFDYQYKFCFRQNSSPGFSDNKHKVKLRPGRVVQTRKNIQKTSQYTVIYFINGLDHDKLNYHYFRIEQELKARVKFQEESDFVFLEDSEIQSLAAQPIKLGSHQAYFGITPQEYADGTKTSFLLIKGDFELPDNRAFSIGRFLSLIFGAEFSVYGYAKLDSDLETNYTEYLNVSEIYFDTFSKYSPRPIIPLWARDDITETLSKLYNAYFWLALDFNMDVITSFILESHRLSMETQIQPLSAAFDALTNAWLQKNDGDRDMSDSEFQEIISDLLKTAAERLKDIPNCEKIINRMRYANNLGHSQRGKAFLSGIGITLSRDEEKILKSRHSAVHGGNNSHDVEQINRMNNGYRSLLARIILKLLDYQGKYIDYANLGFPRRNMDESITLVNEP